MSKSLAPGAVDQGRRSMIKSFLLFLFAAIVSPRAVTAQPKKTKVVKLTKDAAENGYEILYDDDDKDPEDNPGWRVKTIKVYQCDCKTLLNGTFKVRIATDGKKKRWEGDLTFVDGVADTGSLSRAVYGDPIGAAVDGVPV